MAIDTNQHSPERKRPKGRDGPGLWLWGTLGLLGFLGLAARSSRFRKAHNRPMRFWRLPAVSAVFTESAFPGRPRRGHESRDVNAKWILIVVVSLLAFGAGVQGFLAVFLRSLEHTSPSSDMGAPVAASGSFALPGPRLQVAPAADLEAFRAREDVELHSYGWINRTSGIVRIPIERAMELVLEGGLPTRRNTNGVGAGLSWYELIQQRAGHRERKVREGK